jgi:hypothetical protein
LANSPFTVITCPNTAPVSTQASFRNTHPALWIALWTTCSHAQFVYFDRSARSKTQGSPAALLKQRSCIK